MQGMAKPGEMGEGRAHGHALGVPFGGTLTEEKGVGIKKHMGKQRLHFHLNQRLLLGVSRSEQVR